jgi:hypothetical protein
MYLRSGRRILPCHDRRVNASRRALAQEILAAARAHDERQIDRGAPA